MSFLSDTFAKSCGKPDPAVAPGLKFSAYNPEWEVIQKEIGAGWFMNRFLYLLGEGLDELMPCLDAWSFAVPPKPNGERVIIGRNGYGALLVLEDANDIEKQSVHLLDPVNVRYWTDPQIGFLNLFGHWLPKQRVPSFLDHSPYDEWLTANGNVELELRDILGFKTPIPLGGEMDVDDLQLEDIVEYYKTTGPIYRDAYETQRRQSSE